MNASQGIAKIEHPEDAGGSKTVRSVDDDNLKFGSKLRHGLGKMLSRLPHRQQQRPGHLASKPIYETKSTMTQFRYSSLQPLGADEIRVFGFENTEDSIRIQHIGRPSDESTTSEVLPAYYALSYAWGSGKQDCQILINGVEFPVSADLRNALRHLQSDQSFNTHNIPILLWVDAICIDQDNTAEKVTQVLRMKETYESACKVIVWLGDEPERREATGRAASFLLDHIPLTSEGRVPILGQPHYFRDPGNAPILRTIGQNILRRPWWWRMWVIQEVAVAKSLAVICDGHQFSWDRLLYTVQWISIFQMEVMNPPAEEVEENPFFPNIMFKSGYRHRLEHGETIPILDLLQNASSCLATNPRDMIFSLLGLATDIEALPTVNSEHKLVCNYERSVQEVYIDFAKVHIQTHNSLEVTTFSRNYDGRTIGLPSWVPDWSDLGKSSCFSLGNRQLHSAARLAISNPYAYQASGGRSPEFEFLHGAILRVSGILVDTVTQVGKPFFDPSPPGEKFHRTIAEWQAIALGEGYTRASESYVGTEQTLIEAFDRTLTADMNLEGNRVQKFESYLSLEESLVLRRFEGIVAQEHLDQWNKAQRAVYLRILRRVFFTTSGARFGLGPWDARAGDKVFVLLGCNVPVILRQDGNRWDFIGETFVLGIMDGEMSKVAERDGESEDVEHGSGLKVESILIS